MARAGVAPHRAGRALENGSAPAGHRGAACRIAPRCCRWLEQIYCPSQCSRPSCHCCPRERPMDGSAFDSLTRTLTVAGSRRHALGGVLAGALGLLGAGAEHASARKQKPCPPCKKRKKGKCKARLPDGAGCTDTSGQGGKCQLGRCVPSLACPAGQRPCRGSCLSVLICCVDQDCAGGRTCQDGTCACPATKPHVCEGSTVCRECCQSADCWPNGQDQGDGQICQGGVCTCTVAGTRRCTSGIHTGECGRCCLDSECPEATICVQAALAPASCLCAFGPSECLGYCVDEACNGKCNQPCDNPGAVCCGSRGTLICQPQQAGGARCQP